MFACIIRNIVLYPRIAEYVGDTFNSLLGASASAGNEWVYGTGASRTSAAEAAIHKAYDKFGLDKVGETLAEPMGFLVEFNSVTGKISDYELVKVKVREGAFPLRLHYVTPDGAAQLNWY